MRLAQKVALICGGATGIGRAVALRFAQEGAAVAVADINVADGEATAGAAGGVFVRCDIAHAPECLQAVAHTVAAHGGLDILVNAAAYLGGAETAATISPEAWRSQIGITLDGVLYCSKYSLPEMVKRGGGAIIHIASVEGMMGATRHVAYVTAKSALLGLTRSMAIDFGQHGIRVNAISPGIIDTGRPDLIRLKQEPAVMKFWREMTVLDRMGHPEEIAAAALFLASDEASYITGQNLAVDGGWTIGHAPISWPADRAP